MARNESTLFRLSDQVVELRAKIKKSLKEHNLKFEKEIKDKIDA